MIDFIEVLAKLKDILSNELGNKKIFDKDIATSLNINYDNFRKAKSNGKIPYFEVMSFLAKRNISINWFFFNQIPESLLEPTSKYIILKYRKNTIASAGGGAINYEVGIEPLIIDKQLLDYINSSYKYTEMMQVFGESMEPDVKEGSLIFVDQQDKTINRKNIYLIKTNEGMFIKYIDIVRDKYYMISANKQYKEVELDDFEIIGKIKGALNKI